MDNIFGAGLFQEFSKTGLMMDDDKIRVYYKWLNYNHDNLEIIAILDKKASELTMDEIDKLKDYKNTLLTMDAFKRYLNHDLSNNSAYLVSTYMMRHPIEKLMRSRLSNDELKEVDLIIDKYIDKDIKEVEDYINTCFNDYENISYPDAYASFFLDDSFKVRAQDQMDKRRAK